MPPTPRSHSFSLHSVAPLKLPSLRPRGISDSTWQVDGVTREGLLHVPEGARTKPAPIIFAWHGHGGTMGHAQRSFGYDKLWPEAISVYLQGLNTPGRLVDKEGTRPGWQGIKGDMEDRDLKFFDTVLAQSAQGLQNRRPPNLQHRALEWRGDSRICSGRIGRTSLLPWHLPQHFCQWRVGPELKPAARASRSGRDRSVGEIYLAKTHDG